MVERAHAADRLDELLVARATEGLDAAEQRELEELLASRPDVDAEGFERAAAAVHLAAIFAAAAPADAMPRALRERLASSAARFADSLPSRR
jgi:hypothetical protein